MAFNRKSPADLAALKSEVTTDPNGQGYAAVITETPKLLRLLNDPLANAGKPTIDKPLDELTPQSVASVIDAGEYAALDAYGKVWVDMFIKRPADEALTVHVGKFRALFPNGSTTLLAVQALRSKPASRAEILFGVNTVIGRDDFFAARDS